MKRLLTGFSPAHPVSKRQQITDYVRGLVIAEELLPGTKLPPTDELAKHWGAPAGTVQSALTPLVKEGLLYRRPRLGTFVREREAKLTRVGLYLSGDLGMRSNANYSRCLLEVLRQRLAASRLEHSFWIDPRPSPDHDRPWPELVTAVASRRIQALLVPGVDDRHLAWLDKLPLPKAFHGSGPQANFVHHDLNQFVTVGMEALAAAGCRSAGVISVLAPGQFEPDGRPHHYQRFYDGLAAVQQRGLLEVRPEWILAATPGHYVGDAQAERFGYESARALWRRRERPEGLLVYTDVAARGLITALLEMRVDVPRSLKLALHRNVEIGLLCPFPATFIDVRAGDVADALIAMVDREFRGQPPSPVHIGCTVVPAEVHKPQVVSVI